MAADFIRGIEDFLFEKSVSYFGLKEGHSSEDIKSIHLCGNVYSLQFKHKNKEGEEYTPGDYQAIPKIHHHLVFKLAGAAMMAGIAYLGMELFPEKISQLNQSIPYFDLERLAIATSGLIGITASGIKLNENETGIESIQVIPFPPKKY